MNKAEFIDFIANAAEISKAAAERALNAVTDGITNTLQDGRTLTLVGFGTFEARPVAARTVRNPQDGSPINLKATRRATFKAGKALKEAVAKNIEG